ncbi:MAG: hypothetical protein ACI88H_003696 [Cocleimonas sp.]|jgi:hypothetical protein
MEESILEFHLEYSPDRKNPAEIFHAMGDFISAYEQFGKIIAESVSSDLIFDVELKEVTHGCILAKLILRTIESFTRPDDLIRSLTGEISLLTEVQAVTQQERIRIKKELGSSIPYSHRIDPTINDLDVALAMEKWSEGNSKLNKNEHLTICNEGEYNENVIPFDPKFRFAGDIKKMFSNFVCSHDGEEIIEVIRPCGSGNAQWEVKSVKSGRKFNAEITHKRWLDEYQNSEKRLGGSDYLRVHSQYDIINERGEHKIRNAKIIEVLQIIEHQGKQNELPE